MSAFSSRRPGYRAGLYFLFLATMLFVIGYGSPYWTQLTISKGYLTASKMEGLWMHCNETRSLISYTWNCGQVFNTRIESADWFKAVRVLVTMSLIGLLGCCAYAMVTNCCRTVPGPRVRHVEILTALSGALGLTGMIVYLCCHPYVNLPEGSVIWGYYFSLIGAILMIISAILVAVFNSHHINVCSARNPTNPLATVTGCTVVMHGDYSASGQPYVVYQQPGCQPCIVSSQGTRPFVLNTQPVEEGQPITSDKQRAEGSDSTKKQQESAW